MTAAHPAPDADRITRAVEQNFDRQVALLQRLVREPSQRGREAPVQAIVADELAQRGYDVERIAVDPGRFPGHPAFSPATIDYAGTFNVVGRTAPAGGTGRSLILNAHVDVVPLADETAWTHPPYSGARDGDWLYGRGAGDMKAGLVANIFALDALRSAGARPAGAVEIQSVIDEESTGNGAAAAIVHGRTADAVLVPEPTDETLVCANSGVVKFRITVRGVPAHPRDPESGISAIDAAIGLIGHLKRLEARWNEERTRHAGFADVPNPASLNIGTIAGGEWLASIPFSCTFEGRIGFYPGDDPKRRAAELEAFVAEAARTDATLARSGPTVEWVGVMQGGYRIEPSSPAIEHMCEAHGLAHGSPLRDEIMTCYLDAALFALHAGMPAIVYGPVAENIHGIDERVSLSSLKRVTTTIALFTALWCGVDGAED